MDKEIVELFSADERKAAGLPGPDPWDVVYNEIRVMSDSAEVEFEFRTSTAEHPDNWRLNRWRDVKPYDHSRVIVADHPKTDYINASLVKVPEADRSYILTQGPLPTTVGHFWLMVWQNNTRAILMLNKIFEKGILKCHQYWPEPQGAQLHCDEMDEVGLTLEHLSSQSEKHYTVRTLRLTHMATEETREILHFHYTAWPDFGVPKCPDSFLDFLKAVKSSGSLESSVGPAVVHCSAGVGRSGTFCLVDSCLVLLEKEGPDSTKIRDLLVKMRQYRMRLIQTKEQLKFSYVAIVVGGTRDGLWPSAEPPTDAADENEGEDKLRDICGRLRGGGGGGGSEDSDTDSSDDDDAGGGGGGPPPPPPPRTQSLSHQADAVEALLAEIEQMRQMQPATVMTAVNGDGGGQSTDEELPLPPAPPPALPPKASPQHSTGSEDSSTCNEGGSRYILNDHKLQERKTEVELRRRLKAEKQAATQSKINDIKNHMRESEEIQAKAAQDREQWRKFLVERALPFGVGMAMFLVGGFSYFVYRYPR